MNVRPSQSLAAASLLWLAVAPISRLEAQGPPPAPVHVAPVVRKAVRELRPVVGNLRAVSRSEVSTIEPGRVETVLVEVGSIVTAGDRLAVLDSRRLALSLLEAKASEGGAEETVHEREAGLERVRADLASIEKALEESPGAVSEQQLRTARIDVTQAEARLAVARRDQSQATIRRELLQVRIKDTTIEAPFTGRVVARSAEPGEWLAAGGTVCTLVSTGVHEAWIEVDESFDYGVLNTLESVRVRIDSTGAELDSVRVRVVGDVDPRSRRFMLVADLSSKELVLAPGMSVTAQVPTGREVERLLVPSDALVRDSGGGFVYAVRPGPGGQKIAMPVSIDLLYGLDADTVVCDARAALQDGESVVIEGNERLRPMAPVAPSAPAEGRAKKGGGR